MPTHRVVADPTTNQGVTWPAPSSHGELHRRLADAWGPATGEVSISHSSDDRAFAVTTFGSARVARLATVGLGACQASDDIALGLELMLVIGSQELAELGGERVSNFLADVSVHLLRYSVRPTEGSVIPKTSIAPWAPDALLFDNPRGEPESLEELEEDGRLIRLVWAVPIYANEAKLIEDEGVESLDDLVDRSSYSLADVLRPSVVS